MFDALEMSLQFLEHLVPVETRIRQRSASLAKQLSDASESIALNLGEGRLRRAGDKRRCEPFIAVHRQRRGSTDSAPPSSSPEREAMRALLATPRGKQVYSRRKCTVEPVFGQIFAARGFRQFLLRGMRKVRFEWTFLCLTHNLLKLFRARHRPLRLPETAIA